MKPRLPDPREKPWLTVAELAEITGEGEKVIRAALEAGQLPELRIGRYVRIPTAALLLQLGIEEQARTDSEAGPSTGPATASTTSTPPQELQHVNALAPVPTPSSNVHALRNR